MTGKRNHTSPIDSPTSENIADKDQDRFLPIANVSRIMKKSLPANAKISKDAKETVQECVSEFISFITGEASDKCQKEKRKTINGDDLLWAMTTLGFENYVGPLKVYLNKYRETEGEKNSMARLEEISPNPNPNPNLDPNPNHGAVNKGNNSFCLSGTNSDFHNFNMGFYSIGAQVTPKSSGENTRVISYGESLGSEAFNLIRVHENGDENGDCRSAMASHVHGVDW